MSNFTVVTGYGFFLKNNVCVGTYNLPVGEHQKVDDITVVEVASKEDLDRIPVPFIYYKYENNNFIPDESKKQTLIEILNTKINAETDAKVLNDFVYQGKEFYLSLENQFNYKSAYDARNSLTYPYMVKGKTEFLSFANASEFEAFYTAGFSFIQGCITDGWTAKEALNTKTMEELLELL